MVDTSKEAVKFFEPDCYAGNAFMEEDQQGCWVGIEDYEALRAELDEAKADIERLNELLDSAEQACEDRADRLDDMGIEVECCVATAKNCADDIRNLREDDND